MTDEPKPATPLPWTYGDFGGYRQFCNIGDFERAVSEQDWNYAVHAANALPALQAMVKKLERVLRECRNEALEEAAKIAEAEQDSAVYGSEEVIRAFVAAAIRKLKGEKT